MSDPWSRDNIRRGMEEVSRDKLVKALEWYAERARSLAENDWHKKPQYAEAIFTELALDGGHRAEAAIAASK